MTSNLNVLYEDNHLIGVVKPFNMPVQRDFTEDPDLLNEVKTYIKHKHEKPGDAFAALVHRLDRPAGGVMIFARTSKAASRLTKAFKDREVEKQYLCIVNGHISPTKRRLKHWLKKDPRKKIVTAYKKPVEGSKKAILQYQRLQKAENLSLVSVILETGRSHQIRCQLSKVNYPLYGDHKYGDAKKGEQLALWSRYLCVPHPVKDDTVELEAPPPQTTPWNLFELDS
mgnify:CR=1 FL=1